MRKGTLEIYTSIDFFVYTNVYDFCVDFQKKSKKSLDIVQYRCVEQRLNGDEYIGSMKTFSAAYIQRVRFLPY